MNLPTLVWRNLVRRRGRFTLTGTAIGVAAFVALLTLGQGLTRDVHRQAQGLGADLVVTPKGWCAYEQISVLTGEQLPEAIPEAEVGKIVAIPGLKAVVPHLNEQTAFRNRPVPVIGVVPADMRALRGWTVSAGRYFAFPLRSLVVAKRQLAVSRKDRLRGTERHKALGHVEQLHCRGSHRLRDRWIGLGRTHGHAVRKRDGGLIAIAFGRCRERDRGQGRIASSACGPLSFQDRKRHDLTGCRNPASTHGTGM